MTRSTPSSESTKSSQKNSFQSYSVTESASAPLWSTCYEGFPLISSKPKGGGNKRNLQRLSQKAHADNGSVHASNTGVRNLREICNAANSLRRITEICTAEIWVSSRSRLNHASLDLLTCG